MGTTLRNSLGNLEELSSCTEHELEKGTLSKVYGVQIDTTNCRVLKVFDINNNINLGHISPKKKLCSGCKENHSHGGEGDNGSK